MNTTIKCIALSDMHGQLPEIQESSDLVLICGDICPTYIQKDHRKCRQWFKNVFIPWCESLFCDKVIFIAGNHDFFLESHDPVIETDKVIYLKDSLYEYKEIKIYGTPWCINLPKWAFYTSDESEYLNIPECDILLTHQPPMIGSVGLVHQNNSWSYMKTFASLEMANAIKDKGIKWMLCGHVHTGNHFPEYINDTWFANVSILDEDYKLCYEPLIFKI